MPAKTNNKSANQRFTAWLNQGLKRQNWSARRVAQMGLLITLGVVVAVLWYKETRQPKYLFLAAASLALFGATMWVGLIIGSGFTGTAIQNLGMVPTLVSGASLGIVAIILLVLIRRPETGVMHITPVEVV